MTLSVMLVQVSQGIVQYARVMNGLLSGILLNVEMAEMVIDLLQMNLREELSLPTLLRQRQLYSHFDKTQILDARSLQPSTRVRPTPGSLSPMQTAIKFNFR